LRNHSRRCAGDRGTGVPGAGSVPSLVDSPKWAIVPATVSRRCGGTRPANRAAYAATISGSARRNGKSVATIRRIASSGTGERSGRKSGFHRPALGGGPSWNSPIIRPRATYSAFSASWVASMIAGTSAAGRSGNTTRIVRYWAVTSSGPSRSYQSR
jgi:hypothetical protein